LPKYEEHFLQATSIQVNSLPYPITVSAVYCPPRHNLKKENYKNYFATLGPKFIAGGDYNSKHTLWGSRLSTTKGRELEQVIRRNNYSILSTGSPTYWPTDPQKIPDLLDFFVINGISTTYTNITSSYDLSSDHSPIIATIGTTPKINDPPPRLHNSKTNWETYRQLIQNTINLAVRLKSPEDIEREILDLTSLIQHAARMATPQLPLKHDTNYISLELKQLIAQKRRARSIWQRTHTPNNRTRYNQLSNILKSKLRELHNNSYTYYISNLSRHDYSIWKPIKSRRKPITSIPPLRLNKHHPGPWAKSDIEKADLFAEYLSEVFTPHNIVSDVDIEQHLDLPIPDCDYIRHITPKELRYEISILSIKKTPGADLITPTLIKELPKKGFVKLLYILNAIIRIGYWPKPLKTAHIIMIPKPGKPLTDPSSYRPISLLPTISKMLEKLLLNRLKSDTNTANWIPDHQFGFRQAHSTVQQCHRLAHIINHSMENKQYCTAAFLDVNQAFDKVWHLGLLHKIKKFLPIQYFKLLKSYLSEREFAVKMNNALSNQRLIQSGVPQGSVLGPFLYVLYTSDIPTTEGTQISTFADDTAIFATNDDPVTASTQLQKHLNLLERWFHRWKIKVNESKSAHVTFTLRKGQCPPIYLNQIPFRQQDNVKYLGLHLDSKLTWKHHIVTKRKQIDIKFRELSWLLGKRSPLTLDNKLLLYKTIIRPIWTYGIQLWSCASMSNIAIIQRCQSKILRAIVDAPWYVTNSTLHTDLQIPYVSTISTTITKQHYGKLAIHPNSTMEPLLHPPPQRRLRRIWPYDLKDN
jgi:hypothetical protein